MPSAPSRNCTDRTTQDIHDTAARINHPYGTPLALHRAADSALARWPMRSLPGLLVEYLINGVVAFVWLVQLYPQIRTVLGTETLLLFIPAVYVVGMAIDLVAFAVGYVPKHMLRRRLDARYGASSPHGGTHRKVFIMHNSSELAEELEKRSSRDRIARGTFVNLFPLLYLYGVHPLLAAAALAFALIAWLWFESQSYTFEIQAAAVLDYPGGPDNGNVDDER